MKVQDDIRKFLHRNAVTVWMMAGITAVAVVASAWVCVHTWDQSRKTVYAVGQTGDLIPLHLVERRKNRVIEIKDHLTRFVDNYYNLSQFNWKIKTEKALNLGDLKKDWSNKYSGGYYAALTQYNIERRAELAPGDIEVGMGENGREWFKIAIQIVESGPTQLPKKFLIFARGEVVDTDQNWPNNPHGLFIVDYLEEKTIQVNTKK